MNWLNFFIEEIHKKEIRTLIKKISYDYQNYKIYPPKKDLLKAFQLTTFDKVKVLIIGQDPYHEQNQAMGLAFSVPSNSKIPPSLVNIFKEYHNDLNYDIPKSGDLTKWAKNGVLLLNSVLHVKEGEALSCNYIEYETFLNDVVSYLNLSKKRIVFILWGAKAQKVEKLINKNYHLVLKSSHPSPLASYRGFFGSKPFSKTNTFLKEHGQEVVDWKL